MSNNEADRLAERVRRISELTALSASQSAILSSAADALVALAKQQAPEATAELTDAWRVTVGKMARALEQAANHAEAAALPAAMREVATRLNHLLVSVTTAEPAAVPVAWESNVRELLDKCPHTIRMREGAGPENLVGSLCVTFASMEAALAAQGTQKAEAVAVAEGHTYLCRAWGETDLPCVTIARSREEVREFYIREWLGDENDRDHSGELTLPRLMAEFDEHPWQDGEIITYTFEIGGVSVERVFA